MQEVIAGLEHFTFAFEKDVETQRGTGLLPFQGMDKSAAAVCNYFWKGLCGKGKRCPFRHDSSGKKVVCKHWLRGLCKMGDQCKFLHQYDVTKMPQCYFFSKFGDCSNKECPFLHVKATSRTQDCPWYNQGFCSQGPLCTYRHVQKVMCINYLAGFCPEGPKCRFAHPKMKFSLSPSPVKAVDWSLDSVSPGTMPSLGESWFLQMGAQEEVWTTCLRLWPLHQDLCYKCQEMGHSANKCSKVAWAGLNRKQHVVRETGSSAVEDVWWPDYGALCSQVSGVSPLILSTGHRAQKQPTPVRLASLHPVSDTPASEADGVTVAAL